MYAGLHSLAIAELRLDAGAAVDVRSMRGMTPLQMCATNTDHRKRTLVTAEEAGAKPYALPEVEADGKVGCQDGFEELVRRAQLAMAKLLAERGADVEALYPQGTERDPALFRE
jgi:hypothetical protein